MNNSALTLLRNLGISLTLLIRIRDIFMGLTGLYLGSHYSFHALRGMPD